MNIINWYKSTAWHKWWMDNVWKPSWTRMISAIYGLPATLVVVGQSISSFANDHTISGYLAQMNVPNWVPMGLATVSLLYYVAHGRD